MAWKIDPTHVESYGYYSGNEEFAWVGAPQAHPTDEAGKRLVARRFDLLIHGGVYDEDADYSFDDWALVELDGEFYLVNAAGCSCPSHEETWGVDFGPATLGEIRGHLLSGDYSGYSVPARQLRDFINLIDRVEREMNTVHA
jgi:hypothetical protein